jgi:hypothetical protein
MVRASKWGIRKISKTKLNGLVENNNPSAPIAGNASHLNINTNIKIAKAAAKMAAAHKTKMIGWKPTSILVHHSVTMKK